MSTTLIAVQFDILFIYIAFAPELLPIMQINDLLKEKIYHEERTSYYCTEIKPKSKIDRHPPMGLEESSKKCTRDDKQDLSSKSFHTQKLTFHTRYSILILLHFLLSMHFLTLCVKPLTCRSSTWQISSSMCWRTLNL